MAPPTHKPRLAVLDREVVAKDVQDQVLEHLRSLAFALDPTIVIPDPQMPQLGWTVQALVEYAQKGKDAETDDPQVAASFAHDRIGEVLACLYSSAADGAAVSTDALHPEVVPETPIGCVLVAAWARTLLAVDEPVTAAQLAVLASVDAQHVRLLARENELRIEDGQVEAKEARRWLSGRGVAA